MLLLLGERVVWVRIQKCPVCGVGHLCIHTSAKRKHSPDMLWLILDKTIKLYLLILTISDILLAFAPLCIWGKPCEEVHVSYLFPSLLGSIKNMQDYGYG